MEDGFVKLSAFEASILTKLAAREHRRRVGRKAPPAGYRASEWAMEVSGEAQQAS